MSSTLCLEFFDTDASSYRHRLAISLLKPGAFFANQEHLLEIQAADGTTRFVPLFSIKQFYVKDRQEVTEWAPLLVEELVRRVVEAGFVVPADLNAAPASDKAGFLLEVLVEAEITARDNKTELPVSAGTITSSYDCAFTEDELRLIVDVFSIYFQHRDTFVFIPVLSGAERRKQEDLWAKLQRLLQT